MKKFQTAERVSAVDASDNYVYQRSLLAYHKAAEMVSGDVLEIGTGSGYGISLISPASMSFLTIDKHTPPGGADVLPNVEFRKMKVPPLTGIPDSSFDYVVTFQVIEHIRNDRQFVSEIRRVLKPGGKLIITTPNRTMSLTRNPWHVREYTLAELEDFLKNYFGKVECMGVFGNEKVNEYYMKNRDAVKRIVRYDIFGFQKWLPRFLLRIPYDLLNRLNRRKLYDANSSLTEDIRMNDYYISDVNDECFDLFYVAEKM